MPGKIPQSFIDDLLDRADILSVVGTRLELRKSGKNYSARCPFHEEKTPSFTVAPDKQFYYCFGCGAGGNAIGFVMDYDRVEFPEAVERLAHNLGLEVPHESSDERHSEQDSQRKQLIDTLAQADSFYRSQLRHQQSAAKAVDYLKKRGLSGKIAAAFGIGYAPPGWDNLLQQLGQDDTQRALLEKAGLIIHKEDNHRRLYDRFRNRVMFPIRDARGRVLGFGGRVLGDDTPKYLNSPETPVFHKGHELYGLYEARRSLRDISELLVVEGYMDVVALAQHGIHNAVATLGTAATSEHMEKLYRFTSDVVFCFDGDNAGRQAARRALETCLPAMQDGRSARFLFLPEGEDPDSLVRKSGADAFNKRIKDAQPLSDFLFATVAENLNISTPDGKAKLSKLAAPLINRMPQGVFRQLMLKKLAEITGINGDTLSALVSPPPAPEPDNHAYENPAYEDISPAPFATHQEKNRRPSRREPLAAAPSTKRVKLPPVHRLIALLVHQPHLATQLDSLDELAQLEDAETELLLNLVQLLQTQPDYSLTHILGYWRGVYGEDQGALLARIVATDLLRPPGATQRDNNTELQDIVKHLRSRARSRQPARKKIEQLLAQDCLTRDDQKAIYDVLHNLTNEERTDELIFNIKQVLAKPVR